MTDVLILGLGPAGRALAHRCEAAGLDVSAVDPHPHRRWTPTYAAWADELPAWMPAETVASIVEHPAVFTTRRATVDRPYCVLDTAARQESLHVDPARIITATATGATRTTVHLDDGRVLRADHVIDARGAIRRGAPEQSAYGVVVTAAAAEPALAGAPAWFMDWRDDHGGPTPSFLYAMPLGDETVLLEETCLVGAPALTPADLRDRLHARLAARGVQLDGAERIERVRFPVTAPRNKRADPTGFGARGRLMHPGTGYSVAQSLGSADTVVDAITAGRDPYRALWPPRARAVHALRTAGLHTLLGLAPQQVAPFFSAFFDLPVTAQRAYLSSRTDLGGVASTMAKLFAEMPPDVRRVAFTRTIAPGVRSHRRTSSTKMEQ